MHPDGMDEFYDWLKRHQLLHIIYTSGLRIINSEEDASLSLEKTDPYHA